jgi:hypothetical protein
VEDLVASWVFSLQLFRLFLLLFFRVTYVQVVTSSS